MARGTFEYPKDWAAAKAVPVAAIEEERWDLYLLAIHEKGYMDEDCVVAIGFNYQGTTSLNKVVKDRDGRWIVTGIATNVFLWGQLSVLLQNGRLIYKRGWDEESAVPIELWLVTPEEAEACLKNTKGTFRKGGLLPEGCFDH